MRKIYLSVSFLLAAAVLAYPQMVSFKLTGGLTWINGGDYNRGIVGENSYIKDTTQTMSGSFEELKNGMNFQAEIINYLNSEMAVGFGGGYYRMSNESRVISHGILSDVPFDVTSTYKNRLSGIPFFLNFHYMPRLASNLSLDIFAGPVFQIVQVNFENPSTSSVLSTNQTVTFSASAISLGAQGGLGLNLKLSPGISLFVEGCYRFGKISDIKGNWTDIGTSENGAISNSSSEYYLWFYESIQGGRYPRMGYYDNNGPQGDSMTGAKKAEIDLSGMTASAGIKFMF